MHSVLNSVYVHLFASICSTHSSYWLSVTNQRNWPNLISEGYPIYGAHRTQEQRIITTDDTECTGMDWKWFFSFLEATREPREKERELSSEHIFSFSSFSAWKDWTRLTRTEFFFSSNFPCAKRLMISMPSVELKVITIKMEKTIQNAPSIKLQLWINQLSNEYFGIDCNKHFLINGGKNMVTKVHTRFDASITLRCISAQVPLFSVKNYCIIIICANFV